jgi:hypothetical protein
LTLLGRMGKGDSVWTVKREQRCCLEATYEKGRTIPIL